MRRTKEQAAQTRRAILESAKTLFLQSGFEHVSLDEIAAASGVKRGAVHFHFVNKAGLLTAICEEIQLPMQELAARLDSDGTLAPLTALDSVIGEVFTQLDADPRRRGLLRIAIAVQASRLDDESLKLDLMGVHDRVKATLLELFRAAERQAPLTAPWSARTAALALHGLLSGLVWDYANREDSRLVPDGLSAVQTLLAATRRSEQPISKPPTPRRRRPSTSS